MCDLVLKNTNGLVKTACQASEKLQKQLIQLAVTIFQHQPVDIDNISFEDKDSYSKEQLYDLIGLYVSLVKIFVHTKKDEFEDKLIQAGFTQDFIERFPIKHENKAIITSSTSLGPNLNSLRWGIDISLCNSVLRRKVPPWIVFNITLNSGKQYTFVADINIFHKLRFNIALILKELQILKNTSVVRR